MFEGKTQVRLEVNAKDTGVQVMKTEAVSADKITFTITQKGQEATISYNAGEGDRVLATGLSTKILSTESAGGFVGCTIGMYTTASGKESNNTAFFSGIDYKVQE